MMIFYSGDRELHRINALLGKRQRNGEGSNGVVGRGGIPVASLISMFMLTIEKLSLG